MRSLASRSLQIDALLLQSVTPWLERKANTSHLSRQPTTPLIYTLRILLLFLLSLFSCLYFNEDALLHFYFILYLFSFLCLALFFIANRFYFFFFFLWMTRVFDSSKILSLATIPISSPHVSTSAISYCDIVRIKVPLRARRVMRFNILVQFLVHPSWTLDNSYYNSVQ